MLLTWTDQFRLSEAVGTLKVAADVLEKDGRPHTARCLRDEITAIQSILNRAEKTEPAPVTSETT